LRRPAGPSFERKGKERGERKINNNNGGCKSIGAGRRERGLEKHALPGKKRPLLPYRRRMVQWALALGFH